MELPPTGNLARRVWAVVPAAGRGERFEASGAGSAPKQYAPLANATVLAWSLRALVSEPRIEGIVVVLAADDSHWGALAAALDPARVLTAVGGAQSSRIRAERPESSARSARRRMTGCSCTMRRGPA